MPAANPSGPEVMNEPLDLPLPLLHRIHEIGDLIESKYPREYDSGMGRLGLLLLRKPERYDYWCTPTG